VRLRVEETDKSITIRQMGGRDEAKREEGEKEKRKAKGGVH